MTYYYPFKTFRRLTGSNHLAFGITSNLCTWIPYMVLALAASFPGRYGIQQPCFRRWKQETKQQDSILHINLHNSSHHFHVIH